MLGVHAFWSKPYLTGTYGHHLTGGDKFHMYNFEILHFIVSALFYRKLNGPIHLYTDHIFYDYLKVNNFLHFWDNVDTQQYTKFEKLTIDSKTSWTSFKTWLVGQLKPPFLMMDHDNMVYTKIPQNLYDVDVRFAHWELLDTSVYVDKNELQVDGFKFDDKWDWNINVPNTCLLYFNNKQISKHYSTVALDFLSKHKPTTPKLQSTQYLFADQRLLGLLLNNSKYTYGTFSNFIHNIKTSSYERFTHYDLLDQVGFDHTWYFKHKLKQDVDNKVCDDIKPYLDRHEQIIKDNFIEHYQQLKQFFYAG